MRLTCVFNKLMMMMMIQTQTVYTDGRTACLQYNHSILQTSKLFTAFAIFGFRLLRVDYFLIYAELLFFMCPAGQSQTGRWRHTVLNMSVRRSVRPPVCPSCRSLPNLWRRYFDNEWTDFDVSWHSGLWARMKRWDTGVRRSKVKPIRGW